MSEAIASPPSPDVTDEELEQLHQLQVVDASDAVQANAVDSAEEYLSQQTNVQEGQRLARVRAFGRRVWHGNIARDYYRQREIQRGRTDIIESGNVYALAEGSQADHDQAMAAVVERFTDEYIHEDAGETQQSFEDSEQGQNLQEQLRSLITSYAGGELDHDALVEERTRILAEYGQRVHQRDRNRGLIFADNVLEVAHNARSAFEHGVGLERIESAINGKVGEARTGARTEAHLGAVERSLDWMHTHHMSGVNEKTLGLGLAVGLAFGKLTTRKALSATAYAASFGVAAGAFAGAREYLRVGQERTINMRQMAEGGQIEEGSRAREQMETTRYETASASLMTEQMQSLRETLESGDQSNLQNLMANVAAARARVHNSDVRSMDLIDYSSKMAVESERLALDIELARAELAIERALEAGGSGLEMESVDRTIDEQLNQDISAKDQAFRTLRRNRVAKMAVVGAISGVTFGLASQELRSLMDDGLRGVAESAGSDNNRLSLLAGWFNHGGSHGGGGNELHREFYDGGHHWKADGVELPKGYHLVGKEGSHHSWEIRGPDGKNVLDHMDWDKWHDIVKNDHNPHHFHHIKEGHAQIGFDRQGNLDWETRQALKMQGWNIGQHEHYFNQPHLVEHSVIRSPHEYMQHHLKDFTRVHRELWYDNNTPGVYDQNELRLWWGANGGIDAHGNYVFNVSHMTPDGSYHAGLSTNAQELVGDHRMAIALSMSKDTQNYVQFFRIDANGNAVIPHDSFAAKSMFENQNGQAHFTGAYAEAVQLMGKGSDGREATRMLATVVGDNNPHSAPDITHTIESVRTHHYIDYLRPPEGLPVEVPPVIPLYSRRGLENLTQPAALRTPESVGMYYGGHSLEVLRRWINEDPTRLHPRREITNEDGTVSWVEADGSPVERNVDRERSAIAAYLNKERVRNPEYYALVEQTAAAMEPMDDKCRVSVNVPAWMEGKNLRGFLEQYTRQVGKDGRPLDPASYEINVLVNRRRGTEPDDSTEVIDGFIADFETEHGSKPKVNYYNVELDPPNNNVGYARKLLTDAVVLRSLSRSGQSDPHYIETEDADLVRLDERTVYNLMQKLDSNPHLDAVRGKADRDPNTLMKNDYLFLRRRVWDFAEILARQRKYRNPNQPNWNYMWNRQWMNGWNAGYSAEAYALIEGYDPVDRGEDMIIGEKITMVRGDGGVPNLEVVGRVGTRSDGSPRRFIKEIMSGRDAYSEAFLDDELNAEIREKSTEEMMRGIENVSRITPENVSAFDSLINSYYTSFSKTVTPSNEESKQYMSRLMFFIGFKKDDYEITDDRVIVHTWDNVKTALDAYRARAEARLAPASPATTTPTPVTSTVPA